MHRRESLPQTLFEGIQVVLMVNKLHMLQEFAAASHRKCPASEQIAGGPHFARVDVAQGKRAASHQAGDLLAVDPVVLTLPSVNGFHAKGLAEHKVEPFVQAQIGQPVPGKHALDTHYEPVTERLDCPQEVVRLGSQVAVQPLIPLAIEHAQVHLPCVQIDSAIEFVVLIVESHHGPPWEVLLEPRNHSNQGPSCLLGQARLASELWRGKLH